MSKAALAELDAIPLLVLQLASSSVLLWLIVLMAGQYIRANRPARIAALAGLLEPGLSYSLGTVGLALSSASIASTIGATEPIIIMLLATLFLREPLGSRRILGAAGVVAGLLLITNPSASSEGSVLGAILVLGGTFTAAAYVLVAARFSHDVPAALGAARQQSIGLLLALIVLAAQIVLGPPLRSESISGWALMLAAGSGVIQYALAFWLYLWGLKHLHASEAGLLLALIPVFGVLGGTALLGERLGIREIGGVILIVVTLAFTVKAAPLLRDPGTRDAMH